MYTKEPILVLWDAVKSLINDIEIFKETMDADENSIPESYLLLRSDITNTPFLYGDGATKIRRVDCDIILVTKGVATNTTDLHNVNRSKVTKALELAGLPYSALNLGYDDALKSTQYSWSVVIHYG